VAPNCSVLFPVTCVQYVVIGDDYNWNVRYFGRMLNVHIEPAYRQRVHAMDMCLLTRACTAGRVTLTHSLLYTLTLDTVHSAGLTTHTIMTTGGFGWLCCVRAVGAQQFVTVLCISACSDARCTPTLSGRPI
jgi:hypothetical protein